LSLNDVKLLGHRSINFLYARLRCLFIS